jgi:hypothetical protein
LGLLAAQGTSPLRLAVVVAFHAASANPANDNRDLRRSLVKIAEIHT